MFFQGPRRVHRGGVVSPARSLQPLTVLMALLLGACGGAAAPISPSAAPASARAGTPAKPAASAAASLEAKPAGSAAAASGKPAASGAAASIAPAKPGQIITAYAEVVAANSPVQGAIEGGYFQKHGLDVDTRLIESSLAVGALLAGQVPIALVGGSETFAAAIQGGDLRDLGTLSPKYPYKFEVPASIQTPADLKGKKIGISRFGSSSDIATRVGLKKVGIDPDKDVSLVQVGSTAARTAAILSGALDGGLEGVPDYLQLEDKGFHALFDMAALDLPANIVGIVVNGQWLQSHRTEMQAYIDATVETIAREKKDKAFAEGVIGKYLKLGDKRQLDATYDYTILKVMPAIPYATPEQFKDTVDQVAQRDPRAATFDLTKLIDDSFLKSAADRGLDKT
jgi:ABC-type nitrate/sulfonate/bicarbonate transport system substrate-binding protein